ncbi:MAG TPA: (2Fe-2S)-binding protein [Kofleriaceae bacterium]|jgi:xanthine dehydrogenase YagT iron-sulfur-binding subunit|nr:(2Fe-2S)-binding protein [Kofleriaceae bacterium]
MSACAPAGPGVGTPAPDLAVSGLEPRSRGEPRVLAFVHAGLDQEPPADLGAIRAELRGLGAELVVISPVGVWRVRADDPLEPRAAAGDALAVEAAAAAACYGVRPGDDAVFVVDSRGVLRFTHRIGIEHRRGDAVWARLGEALAIAGRAVHARDVHDARQRVLFTRREWVVTCLVVGCATAFLAGCKEQQRPATRRLPGDPAPADVEVTLRINGKPRRLTLDPRTSLLDALRERIGLTGTKKGCDMGQCGACTVLVGGKRITSCLTLAVMAQGKDITTIEGLADGGTLHPVQRAFVEHDGLQCGYCTPGQIMSAVGLLGEGRATSDDEVREQMSGNICRCGAYPNIIAAIQAARRAHG